MGGGFVTTDRALQLRLRTPQWNISRALESVINTRFQAVADKQRQDGRGMCVAEAQDDGYLNMWVPVSYKGNWEHFAGVATHLYINLNPSVAAVKAQDWRKQPRIRTRCSRIFRSRSRVWGLWRSRTSPPC